MSDLFKSRIINDLANVFLNPNEFADLHNINGVDGVACVVDDNSAQPLRAGLERFDGVEKETIMLFISEANWQGKPPAYNQLLSIDMERYRIKKSNIFNGLYEISLEGLK